MASLPPIRPPRDARHATLCAAAAGLLLMMATARAEAPTVAIAEFSFAPATLTVAPGTTVTWSNRDDTPHTVKASDRSFASRPLDTGDRFSFTFSAPGEFSYFCSLHPRMVGKVIVRAP